MKKSFLTMVLLSLLSGCASEPNETANQTLTESKQVNEPQQDQNVTANDLYLKATQHIQNAIKAKTYSQALESYAVAMNHLDVITSRYPTSNIAVSLFSGQKMTSGLTLAKWLELGDALKPLAAAEHDPLAAARLMVEARGGNTDNKAMTLINLAQKHFKAGRKKEAVQLLSQARKAASKDKTVYEWSFISTVYAENGLFSEALEIANEMEAQRSSHIGQALRNISVEYAENGLFSEALEIANKINEALPKTAALINVAVKYSEAGQKEQADWTLYQATNWAKTIDKVSYKNSALREIAITYAKIGEYDRAVQKVSAIDYTSDKIFALRGIAVQYAENDKNPVPLLSQAVEYARKSAGEERYFDEDTYLRDIAITYSQIGLLTRAKKITNEIDSPSDKRKALSEIALRYVDSQMLPQAFETLNTDVSKYDRDRIKIVALSKQAKAGSFAYAYELAREITGSLSREEAIAELAVGHAANGQYLEADKMIGVLEDGYAKQGGLKRIAVEKAKAGNVSEALITANQIEDVYKKALLFADIANESKQIKVSKSLVLSNIVQESHPISSFWG
ncbi:hypothetical protein L4D76_21455 [Photobacterium sagamiensis]|uniref:tetratricopeptide repeat protein n=1 Tax=Photobacterium sagamiensis TaxID=2910241 RepID=UPI003D14C89E